MLTKAIYSKRFCRIMQDSAWFCKIMLNSETFCMFYEKFEAYLPKILLRNYQRLKQTLPIWRYGVQKLNYQRSKLPILKVTNIEVYLYLKTFGDNWFSEKSPRCLFLGQVSPDVYFFAKIFFRGVRGIFRGFGGWERIWTYANFG